MCAPSVPKMPTVSAEQLNQGNVTLSSEKTTRTVGEKEGKKRTVNSLRVPLKNTTETRRTGVNTADTSTGLNIPM